MNEFDLHVHSINRQIELQHESEQWRQAKAAQGKPSTPPASRVALARLGELLIDVGEGLKARYGEALENLPASHITDTHPKSI